MRALSTVLLLLATGTAGAQFPRRPARWDPPAWWVSADLGKTRAASLSDRASNALWQMEEARPWRVGVARGTRDKSFGVTYARASVPLMINGPVACAGCFATVTSQLALVTFHAESALGTSSFTTLTELSAGVARWSGLHGRRGDHVSTLPANNDLAWGVAIGLGLPLGTSVESFVMMDILQVSHEARSTTGGPRVTASTGFSTVHYGLRLRLGRT